MLQFANFLKNTTKFKQSFARLFQRRFLIELCFYLEQFLKAGWSLNDSLNETMVLLPQLKNTLTYSIQLMKKGVSFSQSLKEFPYLFNPLFCSYIFIYEKLGCLSDGFKELGIYLKWKKDFNYQLMQALLYPCFSLALLIGAGIILYTFFIPELLVFLNQMDQDIPEFTKIVLKILGHTGYSLKAITIIGFSLGISFKILMYFSKRCQLLGHRMLYEIPYIGPIKHKQDLIHFFKIVDAFYRQTADILTAINVALTNIENKYFQYIGQKIIEQLLVGKTFSQSLEFEKFMPSLVVKVLKTAEKTNQFSQSIQMIFYLYEHALRQERFILITFLQPCLLIFSGVMLASLLYAVFAPLYNIMGTIS